MFLSCRLNVSKVRTSVSMVRTGVLWLGLGVRVRVGRVVDLYSKIRLFGSKLGRFKSRLFKLRRFNPNLD